MREYIVETKNLKKYYQMGANSVKALDGVDFRVKDQEFVAIIGKSGSGKSTLLHQLLKRQRIDTLYVNFDDPRLFDFEISDFQKLDQIISDFGQRILMFDEIQIVRGWERYVRQKLDEGFRVFVTGSNASLLSKELGTSLTGRHITMELFPFSYKEFCRFKGLELNRETVL